MHATFRWCYRATRCICEHELMGDTHIARQPMHIYGSLPFVAVFLLFSFLVKLVYFDWHEWHRQHTKNDVLDLHETIQPVEGRTVSSMSFVSSGNSITCQALAVKSQGKAPTNQTTRFLCQKKKNTRFHSLFICALCGYLFSWKQNDFMWVQN